MIGLGFRREMLDWSLDAITAEFFEVVPENWIRRDRTPLHTIRHTGRPIYLHGVSLSLGGHAPINTDFLHQIKTLMMELESPYYSDHLAASGDAHQLYDLFPIPLTMQEAIRVSNRIIQAQDALGCTIAVENATWYTNIGDMSEPEFINEILDRSGCQLLLDVNNIVVNEKNHHLIGLERFVSQIDPMRISYIHVAGHEYDERFGMYIDTHSQPVEPTTQKMARHLAQQHDLDILLEWDNDVPDINAINQELSCLRLSTTM